MDELTVFGAGVIIGVMFILFCQWLSPTYAMVYSPAVSYNGTTYGTALCSDMGQTFNATLGFNVTCTQLDNQNNYLTYTYDKRYYAEWYVRNIMDDS